MENNIDEEVNSERDVSLYALANIIEDMKSDELSDRINSLRRLSTVALAIGPERARNELIPFLVDSTSDEDEFVSVLVEQLDNFTTYLGGPDYAYTMLDILELVMGLEEPLCRNGAVKVVNQIIDIMPYEHIKLYILPLIQKFMNEDWFTFHVALTGIIPKTYSRLLDESLKTELRSFFYQLALSEVPITRRSLASQMTEFLLVVDKSDLETEVIPAFNHLINDEHDTVRVIAVSVFPKLISVTKDNKEQNSSIISLLTKAYTDHSWRIRYKVTEIISELADVVSYEYFIEILVPSYRALMVDTESEVRTCATLNLIDFCDKLPTDLVSDIVCLHFIPCIKELISDLNTNVKSASAKVLLSLSKYIGKQNTIEHLMPLFQISLKDQSSDVRLNLISNLGNINEVIGPSELSNSLLPAIMELSDDPKWRVRLAVISFVPLLAEQLGIEFFDDKLTNLCLDWLQDSVYNVRAEAGCNILKLVDSFGGEWGLKFVLPKLKQLSENKSYLLRLTCLFTLNVISESKEFKVLNSDVIALIHKMLEDPVPNVRFNAAKTIKCISSHFDQNNDINDLITSLQNLITSDLDNDVRFFAKDALEHLNSECISLIE